MIKVAETVLSNILVGKNGLKCLLLVRLGNKKPDQSSGARGDTKEFDLA